MAAGILGPNGVIKAPYLLSNDARVAAWHAKKMSDKGITTQADATTLIAYINDGRWVTDCVCGSGVSVDPSAAKAYCFACGRKFTDVVLPADRAAIEALLTVRRLRQNMNWRPGETVSDLAAENDQHEV